MVAVWRALADFIGTSETGVRLLATLLIAPFFAFFYRFFILNGSGNGVKRAIIHHIYFIATGIFICYFCYGWHTVYIIASVVCVSLILRVCELLQCPAFALRIVPVFTMALLLAGYLLYATNEYDVNWTTVQCTLTLKLISVAFDWSDGHKDQSMMNDHQKQVSFSDRPTLIELLGYSLYFGAIQGGPFFQFRRYKEFTEGSLFPNPIPSSIGPAAIQLLKAVSFLAVNLLLSFIVPDHYVYTDDLDTYPLVGRLVVNGIWVQKVFARYVGIWLLADTSCVLSGMGYDGVDKETGKHRWDAMCNVKPLGMQTSCTIQSMIPYFNIQTNSWLLNYVYKRLRFLRSRMVSTAAALLFLAIWHGFHAGYFLGLLLVELPVVLAERQAIGAFKPYFPPWENISLSTRVLLISFGMFWKWTVCAYGMVGVVFLSAGPVIQSWAKVYFIAHVMCLAWLAGRPVVEMILKTRPTHAELRKAD